MMTTRAENENLARIRKKRGENSEKSGKKESNRLSGQSPALLQMLETMVAKRRK